MLRIRQTILNDYKTCPYKAYKGWGDVGSPGFYDVNESPGNKYSNVGIVFHEVMEFAGREIMKGTRPTLEALHVMLEEKMNGLFLDQFDDLEDFKKFRDSVHEQLDWVYPEYLLSNSIIDVEHTFCINNMYEGMPPFTGTIDRIEGDLKTKDVTLMDYKTGKVYTKKQLKENLQACIYSLAFFQEYGFLPKQFVFIFTKFKKKRVVPITQDFLDKNSAEIVRIVTEMRNKHFEPECKNKFFCKNFCEWFNDCPRYKKIRNSKTKGWDALKEDLNK